MTSKASSYRWLVLASYSLTGIVSQLIWITFAPILTIVVNIYGVSEGDVGLLSAVFPLIYIISSIPIGYFIDSKGFRNSVIIGTSFLGIFGLLRPFANTFTLLLVFQTLAAIGQPFVMNSISKLVKAWFPSNEAGLATGIGSLSLFIGIILGLALTPYLTQIFGYRETLIIYGAFSLLSLIIFYITGKESGEEGYEREYVEPKEFLRLFRNKNIVILSALFFIGIGIFTAFTTWIEPITRSHNLPMEAAGTLGGLMIIGGIIGSLIIPGLSDKYATRKLPLMASLLVSSAMWYILTALYSYIQLATALFVLGFFFMSLLPLALELSAESVDKKYVGSANSILWEFSQIGAFLLIIIYEETSMALGWNGTLYLSSALVFISLLLSVFLKERQGD
jgi:predicted MFS family arabinose efflux permease